MTTEVRPAAVDVENLRCQIQDKYTEVAKTPEKGFHFHTGGPLALMLGYSAVLIDRLPVQTVDSFAGTGNPFSMGALRSDETVLDIGCGAGFDSLIAAMQVGPAGSVVAVDMTPVMLEKAAASARQSGLAHIDFREGYAESLPASDASVDVVISNGWSTCAPTRWL
jgi:2-polyprenyl-3-methyl-5-hydroxy-6-metoxy-1,4-benzoquinol methylase